MQNNPNQNFKNAKREWNSPLNIFLSFVLVVSLLLSFVNITGAWFTDDSATGKTISAIIKTGEANLNVYQEDSTGTQTLLSKSLPTGYTQLEYIESTGTQYIDTGIVASNNVTFECKISVSTFSSNYIMGTRVGGKYMLAYSESRYYCFDYGTNSRINLGDHSDTNELITIKKEIGSISVNGISHSITESSFATTENITLFAEKTATGVYAHGSKKIYKFNFWNNGTIVRNFVPAKDSSNVVGMYDLVEGKFYTNKGTGTFVAGVEQKSGSGISLAYDTTNKTNNKVDVENTNNVKLLLKNEDLGSSFGVRYKVAFYAATASGKVELSSSISGMTAPTSSSNGFVFNSTDGYYYYQNSTGANAMFEPATSSGATSKYLMTGFSINYTNATKTLLGGNSIYMEISVESVAV